jgi:membrane protease YdiL (CAAX protease family)
MQQSSMFSFTDIIMLFGIYFFRSFLFAFLEIWGLNSSLGNVLGVYFLQVAFIYYYYNRVRILPNLWNDAFVHLKVLVSNSGFRKFFLFYTLFELGSILSSIHGGYPLLDRDNPYLDSIKLTWFCYIFLTPIGEELAFRGIVFRCISKHSVFLAYFLSSFLFYLYHDFITIQHFIRALIYCWVFYKYRTVFASIFIHGIHNLIAIVSMLLAMMWL